MQVRASTGNACMLCAFEAGATAWRIFKSVGLGGSNEKRDVLKIQRLLNLIGPDDGGAVPPLKEDGIAGPLTMGAITAFQRLQKTAHDSRVDPLGPTLKRMNELPKSRLAERNAGRLARVGLSLADLKAMARRAQRTIEDAMDSLGPLEVTPARQRAHSLADLHFAFGKQPQAQTRRELGFIRTTFVRVSGVLARRPSPVTGGEPWGVSIYAIDPLDTPDWAAYTPMELGDSTREHPDVHSGHVYLCQRIDAFVPDKFTHVLLHELLHFVDDESKEKRIIDYGYRDKAMQLPHFMRMHNADNYALFASHIWYGRARLVASQPELARHIPESL